jgi:hypothetical protein
MDTGQLFIDILLRALDFESDDLLFKLAFLRLIFSTIAIGIMLSLLFI